MALFQLPPTLKVRLNPTKAVSPLERMAIALVKPKGTSETCTTPACSPVPGGLGRARREEELWAGAWGPQAELVPAGWSLAQRPLTAPTAVQWLLPRAWERVVPGNSSASDPDPANEHGLPSTQDLVGGHKRGSGRCISRRNEWHPPNWSGWGLLEKGSGQ